MENDGQKSTPIQVLSPLGVDITIEQDPVVARLLAANVVNDLQGAPTSQPPTS